MRNALIGALSFVGVIIKWYYYRINWNETLQWQAHKQSHARTHARISLTLTSLPADYKVVGIDWSFLPNVRTQLRTLTPPQTGQFKYIFVRTKIISLLSFVENKIVCFLVQEKERFVFVKKVEYKFFHLLISTCRVVTLKKLVWNKKKLLFFGRDISSEFFLLLRGQGSRKRNKIIARSGGKTISSFVSFYYWENKCCWETFETRYYGFTRRFV